MKILSKGFLVLKETTHAEFVLRNFSVKLLILPASNVVKSASDHVVQLAGNDLFLFIIVLGKHITGL